ncbi:hypothetical protein [Lewinella sp. LCG006]|uniref:hypothetical protein n=1 Tax=Lewinella sp. LCG006 TaxID=3231911 RepID=UPI00345FC8FA
MKKIHQWFLLYGDDIKGIIKVIALLVVVVGGYRILPRVLRYASTIKLKGETIGVVTQIRKVEKIYESEGGGKLGVKGYDVKYSYVVDGEEENKQVYLDKLRYTMKERMKLYQLQVGDSVLVKFDLDTPHKSTIAFD